MSETQLHDYPTRGRPYISFVAILKPREVKTIIHVNGAFAFQPTALQVDRGNNVDSRGDRHWPFTINQLTIGLQEHLADPGDAGIPAEVFCPEGTNFGFNVAPPNTPIALQLRNCSDAELPVSVRLYGMVIYG